MKDTSHQDEKIAKMTFASVYPHYVNKIVNKGRTVEELHTVIRWLTGYNDLEIHSCMEEKLTFEQFFEKATIHANASLITGVICGYRVEEIQNRLTQQVRYLDKLIDELAKGKKMEKIIRG